MQFVDHLRIRQVIALIVVVPMLVASIAVVALARGENVERGVALAEMADLEVLSAVRDLEAAWSSESSFYEGLLGLDSFESTSVSMAFAVFASSSELAAQLRAVSDDAITNATDAPFDSEQRQQVDALVADWQEMRAAFAANVLDRERVAGAIESARESLARVTAIADQVMARQGPGWLALDRQSRFIIESSAEVSFLGTQVVSGRSDEGMRQRAAVLIDRSQTAFDAMAGGLSVEQVERLRTAEAATELSTLRTQAVTEAEPMPIGQVVGAMAGLAPFSDVVAAVRSESADVIRSQAANRAATATRNRNLALMVAGFVVILPVLAVVVVGDRLSRRLGRVAEAAHRLSAGEMGCRVDGIGGRDEIAGLSVAFNDVSEVITRSHEQISALADGEVHASVLDDELPGVLGKTLRLALRRLSSSTAELTYQARHDKLTGLLDRQGLQWGLNGLDVEAGWMVVLDLDGFKQINDVHGHGAGDAVLQAVARRLRSATRDGDLIARIGGDEFVMVVGDEETGKQVAARVSESLSRPVEWSDLLLPISASIGWTSHHPEEPFETSLQRADKAMYSVKQARKRCTAFD